MTTKPKLLVEGWRFLPHSYAIVNQWQLLALARRDDIDLKIRDLPFPYAHWKPMRGAFPAEAESMIAALPLAGDEEKFDAVFRMGFPYHFQRPGPSRLAVFMTSEYQVLPPSHFKAFAEIASATNDDRIVAITPSRWSSAACARLGFPPERISVVPHGVATEIFRRDPSRRREVRQAMKMDGFLFFSNGAMTPNKGIDLLLRAFAAVAAERPEARLLLKGLDPIHNSGSHLKRNIDALRPDDRKTVLDRLKYVGGPISMDDLAALYQAADAYVSPYRAEGFNIPVLEAGAAGLPVICTAGGATEDFVDAGFARKILSRPEPVSYDGLSGQHLMPDLDHLIALMLSAIEDRRWGDEAAISGPAHAHAHYRWDIVADKLLRTLLPSGASEIASCRESASQKSVES